MNAWLRHEVEWSRERALEQQRRAENLRNPEWVAKRLTRLHRDRNSLWDRMRVWWENASEIHMLEDDEQREEAAARAEKDAGYWTGLADGASARLAATSEDEELPL